MAKLKITVIYQCLVRSQMTGKKPNGINASTLPKIFKNTARQPRMSLYKIKRRISLKGSGCRNIRPSHRGCAPSLRRKQEICQQNQIQDEKDRPKESDVCAFSSSNFSIFIFSVPGRVLSAFFCISCRTGPYGRKAGKEMPPFQPHLPLHHLSLKSIF